MTIFPQILANGIIAGSIYALLALGFNFIFSTVKFFDLSFGILTVIGGYIVFYLFKLLGLNLFLSIILSVLASGLIGFLIYRLVYSRLRKKKASNLIMLVASLGVFTVLQAIVAIIFSSQLQTLSPVGVTHSYSFLGAVITRTQLIMLFSVLAIFAGLALILKKTSFGKAVRAIGDDEEVTKIIGINTTKIIGWVFFLGSAIAGFAGILIGFDTGIQPTMGMNLLLKAVIASIIGGIGSIGGGVLGAFALGLIENFGVWGLSVEWKDAIAFGLLIIFLIFRPQGIIKR
jgi:branched-chain amino acid transport system permease protein